MSQTHFTKSEDREPGTWKPTTDGGAIIVCPDCGKRLGIGPGITDHTFTEGKVSPSVVCTHPGCAYHEFITLG